MILVDGEDGTYEFEPDINKIFTVERQPTSHEVKGAMLSVLSDIAAQESAMMTTQLVMGNMMAQAQQFRSQSEANQILGKVKL